MSRFIAASVKQVKARRVLLMILCAGLCSGSSLALAQTGQAPRPKPPRAEPPQRRVTDELACNKDSDCVQLPSVCPSCAPCRPTLIQVGNKAARARIEKRQTIVDCAIHPCKPCASAANWRGTPRCLKHRCQAVKAADERCYQKCLQGNMEAAESFASLQARCRSHCQKVGQAPPQLGHPPKAQLPPRPGHPPTAQLPPRPGHPPKAQLPPQPAEPKNAERRCKRSSDCVFRPLSPCACPPCAATWRQAINKKALKEWRDKWARRRCAHRVCPACATLWLGSKAVCRKGQCTVIR